MNNNDPMNDLFNGNDYSKELLDAAIKDIEFYLNNYNKLLIDFCILHFQQNNNSIIAIYMHNICSLYETVDCYLTFIIPFFFIRTSLVAQTVKRLPTMRETWVRSLGQEDPLEKEMATHSSILAWRIP